MSKKRGRLKSNFWPVSFLCTCAAPQGLGTAIFGTPLISFASAPPKQAWAPPPAPVRGWTGPQIGYANPISFASLPKAMSFLMLCATATRPNSTLTFLLDFRRKRLKP